jgi:hypothetical protein
MEPSKRSKAGGQGVNIKGKCKRRSVNAAVHGEVRLGVTKNVGSAIQQQQQQPKPSSRAVAAEPGITSATNGAGESEFGNYDDESTEEQVLIVSVPPQDVRAAKVALESRGWLDKRFRIVEHYGLSDGEVTFSLPLVGRPEGVHQVSIGRWDK